VSTHYRFHKTSSGLKEVLARMEDSVMVKIEFLAHKNDPKSLTAEKVRIIVASGDWAWRGSSLRIKKITELPPPADPRRPNEFIPNYRNTCAPVDALRTVGNGEVSADYSSACQSKQIATRSTVKFQKIPHIQLHQRRIARERIKADRMRPIPTEPTVEVFRNY
jgi:hypothetical protein